MSALCWRHYRYLYSNVVLPVQRVVWQRNCLKHSKVATPPNKFVDIYRDYHGHIQNADSAKDFLVAIAPRERELLLQSLLDFEEDEKHAAEAMLPTRDQLRLVFLHNALPFIGFGFLDNFMMIVAGEYIDTMFGAMLGISTMAAAGFGNLISDVAGVGSASYVETMAGKVGVKAPPLTPQQILLKKTRRHSNMGKVVGVALGCLIGMFPLLFFKKDECNERHAEPSKSTSGESKK